MYAALKASAELLGLLSMMKDLGWEMHGEVYGDANAALGMINRNGFGKTRHIQTGVLWIQQIVAEQRLKFGKVLGTDNPADIFTKYIDEKINNHHTRNLGYKAIGGRSNEAPNLHYISMSMDEYQCGGNTKEWKWLKCLQRRDNEHVRSKKHKTYIGELDVLSGEIGRDMWPSSRRTIDRQRTQQMTGIGPQVVWGYTWQVQGYTGSNSAQLDHPQGSTLTFQPIARQGAGVSWVLCLRHGWPCTRGGDIRGKA